MNFAKLFILFNRNSMNPEKKWSFATIGDFNNSPVCTFVNLELYSMITHLFEGIYNDCTCIPLLVFNDGKC